MEKSADAFRTISEVADLLDTPAHVLRFWESRFPQIKPVKRAGGRRYYRPADVALLVGIRRLLHDEGMTIRGVQKILREQGVRHVAGQNAPVSDSPAGDLVDGEVLHLADVDPVTEAGDAAPASPVPDAEPSGTGVEALIADALRADADSPPPGRPAPVAVQMPLFDAEPAPQPPAPQSQAPQSQAPAAPPPLTATDEPETPPLANRLRHISRRQMAGRGTRAAALAARLSRLRNRIANGRA